MIHSSDPFGIYIHIPFCNSKCRYCDFYSIDNFNKEVVSLYGQRVLETVSQAMIVNKGTLVSIYIGGGTPSIMPDTWFVNLFKIFADTLICLNDIEITVEINPAYITKERLCFFKSIGINRFSIGIQSLNNPLLLNIGRSYSSSQALKIISEARDITENLSLDMIYGFLFPERDIKQEFKALLSEALPDHFSVYAYTPPYHSNAPEMADEDFVAREEDLVKEILINKGFSRYEVSNYARNGKESVHNNLYWKWATYIGIGAGAHSFFKKELERAYYEDNVLSFIKSPTLLRRQVERKDALKEFFMMGLRRKDGISAASVKENFQNSLEEILEIKEIVSLRDNGMIFLNNQNVAVTEKGFNFLSDITQSFFDAIERIK